jgi:hypothetical protein
MTTVFSKKALLPSGWTEDVRLTVSGGLIASIETGATARPSDTQVRRKVAITSGPGGSACTNWPAVWMRRP